MGGRSRNHSVSIDQIEGIGKRITIGGHNEATLASYIVGKKNEDSTNQYFVRHPDEAETYIAELDINLTTKFSDWVNTDLLEITDGDIGALISTTTPLMKSKEPLLVISNPSSQETHPVPTGSWREWTRRRNKSKPLRSLKP